VRKHCPVPWVEIIPEQIHVVGHRYSVSTPIELKSGRNDDLFGQADHEDLAIKIRAARQHADEAADTFSHEIIHSIDSCLRLHLSEEKIGRLASGLWSTMLESPGLLEFFIAVRDGRAI